MFETLTLIQTNKIKSFPCVAMGEKFWKPMLGFARDSMNEEGTILPGEVDVEMSNSPADVVDYIREKIHHAQEQKSNDKKTESSELILHSSGIENIFENHDASCSGLLQLKYEVRILTVKLS